MLLPILACVISPLFVKVNTRLALPLHVFVTVSLVTQDTLIFS